MSTASSTVERTVRPQAQPAEEPAERGSRWPRALWVLLVLVNIAVPAVLAWRIHLTAPTFHLDGAFQTASGLLRLSEGELPGRDYYPYLGIGPVFVLYPLFLLFGGDLTASVFAAHFVTLLTAGLVVATLALLVSGRRSKWLFGLAAAVPATVIALTGAWPEARYADLGCGYCVSLMRTATDPGLSLRPIRAFAPYLLVLLVLFVLSRAWSTRTRMLVIGAASGTVAAVWSNDYGLVSGLGMLALITLLVLLGELGDGRRIRPLLTLWGAGGVAFAATGFLATGGHFLAYLRYNFVDVRGDQFWYYGSWDRQSRVFGPGDLARIMVEERTSFAVVVLLVVAAYTLWTRRTDHLMVAYLGAATLLGGVAATVGGHASAYFWAFRLWGAVVAVAVAVRLLAAGIARLRRLRGAPRRRTGWALRVVPVTAVAAVLALVTGDAVANAVETRDQLASSDDFVWNDELDGYLDEEYADHVALAAGHRGDIVEEYMGLLGAEDGPNTDLAVDSVIHALGEQREAFAAELAAHPGLVVSTAPGATEEVGNWDDDWATWNISGNWWFYRELFRAYEPEQTSPMTLAWTPSDSPATWAPVGCTVSGYGFEVDAPVGSGLYEVELDYTGPGSNARAYSMVRNMINVPMGVRGWMSLDPGATSQAFPVMVHDTTRFPLKDVRGAGSDPLTALSGCTARKITFPEDADTQDLYGPMLLTSGALGYRATPADMTFGNWVRGVNTKQAALAVPNTPANREALADADSLRLADGTTRTITDLQARKPWLLVFLSGETLDRKVAAYPQPFGLEG